MIFFETNQPNNGLRCGSINRKLPVINAQKNNTYKRKQNEDINLNVHKENAFKNELFKKKSRNIRKNCKCKGKQYPRFIRSSLNKMRDCIN